LERTQPGLPLGIGHIKTTTHDYIRHGTLTLFAALNYLEGKLITIIAEQHRHQEWLAFLKKIERETPKDLDIHLIADNYATHKHPEVKAWLAKHPRFHMHFTPTSSSWLNLVERFFRDLTDQIVSGSFTSVKELADKILAYLADRNQNPKRYVWNARGEEILRKIQRARNSMMESQATVYMYVFLRDTTLAHRWIMQPPEQVLRDNRGHWSIESCHYIIDWNYDGDRNQIRTGFGPENITRLRRFAIGLLKDKKLNETIPERMKKLMLNTRAVFDYLKMTRNSNPGSVG